MGKYDLIEGTDREAFVRTCGLFLRVPMNVFSMDKDCNWGGGGGITFQVGVMFWSSLYIITNSMI
jgi:hypothetical protein